MIVGEVTDARTETLGILYLMTDVMGTSEEVVAVAVAAVEGRKITMVEIIRKRIDTKTEIDVNKKGIQIDKKTIREESIEMVEEVTKIETDIVAMETEVVETGIDIIETRTEIAVLVVVAKIVKSHKMLEIK